MTKGTNVLIIGVDVEEEEFILPEYKKKRNVKKFTELVSISSQKLFASFIDDSINERKKANDLQRQINLAVSQKALVVIQLEKESPQHFETISGRIFQNNKNKKTIVVRLQKTNELRLIQLNDIKKLSMLHSSTIKKIAMD